jgi:hypothetical protein
LKPRNGDKVAIAKLLERTYDRSMQRLLVPLIVGVASVVVGGWLLASRYHALDYQLQGKCDFVPCVTAADLPTLLALTGLLAFGFFLLGVAAAGAFWRPHQR